MTELGGDGERLVESDAEAVRLAREGREQAGEDQSVAEGVQRILAVAYNESEARATASAAERDRLLALFAALPVGVVLADARADDQPITFANAAFTALTGYPAAEVLGRNCRFLQGADTDPAEVDVLHRAIADGVGCTVTLRNYRRDGTPFWNELTLTSLRDAEGQAVAYVGVQIDATARVEVERRRAEAEAAVRMRDHLLSLAAHDLRSPLAALIMGVQMQTRRLDRNRVPTLEEWRTWLAAQRELLDRELAVVQEVTDAAYLQMGQHVELRVEPVDLGVLAREAVTVVAASRGDATIEVATDADAGDTGIPIVVAGDRSRLERVLQNVIGNAVKYSPEGTPVGVSVAPTDDGARVVVRDRGVGIPADELPRIFAPFYRASTARGIAGTGLGLAGARAIVEQHGGTIALDSAPGVGTTVTITLPRNVAVA